MLALITAILAGNPPPPPIVNGDTTKDYPQVVTLLSADRQGYIYNFCSGTVIAPGWVVTAGHCTDAFESNEDAGYRNHYVVVGYDITKEAGVTAYVEVADWHTHPSFSMSNGTIKNDIGVVELAEDITDFDPMPVNRNGIGNANIGEEYRYVGWGITSDNATDSTKKRTADLPLDDYDSQFMYGYDKRDDQNVCSGDSGGAALEIRTEGGFELAGVNSFVYSPNGDGTPCAGGATGGTRVDKYLTWIEDYTPTQDHGEMYGDGDTDADADTDSDSDADTDTDGKAASNDDDDGTTETYTWNCSSTGSGARGSIMTLLTTIGLTTLGRRLTLARRRPRQ